MNIDKIEIVDNNNYLEIFPKGHYYIYKDNKKEITDEEIKKFIMIIGDWDNLYFDNEGIDGPIINIKLYSKDIVEQIKIVRKLPDNYSEFAYFLRGLYARR